jgi:hypothetical protein
VGAIEGCPIHMRYLINGRLERKLRGMHWVKRAYSGFQVFRTSAVLDYAEKMEDDYVYRNEDLIFQNAVLTKGLLYLKRMANFVHCNPGIYERNKEDAMDMYLGILKYCKPHIITTRTLNSILNNFHNTYNRISKEALILFSKKFSKNWIVPLKKMVIAEKKK